MNPLKDKLARGEVVASMTVRLVSSVEIVRIAKTAGFDARIDLEHSAHLGFRSVPAAEALPAMNEANMVIVQLESAAALAACKKQGKHAGVGGPGSRPDLVQQYVMMGARFVSTGTDLGFLLAACTERAKQVRNLKI